MSAHPSWRPSRLQRWLSLAYMGLACTFVTMWIEADGWPRLVLLPVAGLCLLNSLDNWLDARAIEAAS